MIRLYHLLLGFILIPIGVTTAASYFYANKNSQPSSSKTTIPTIASTKSNQDNIDNIWENLLIDSPLPAGWKINPCQDKNSVLCVSANAKLLGTVELKILPLKTQPNFEKMLVNAGIPIDKNINYRSPKYITQVTTALNDWVKNQYDLLAKNNKYVYDDKLKTEKTADGILFSAYPAQKARVGKLQGIRYGFAGLKQKGGVQEKHTGYVAFDGKALYLINTAFDPASSIAKFEKLENLSVFQPYLNVLVENLKIPE
ncbi:MAG: hypothetical protein AAF757_21675 [Cyanobacteria bacterium P01_D01_bin.116]